VEDDGPVTTADVACGLIFFLGLLVLAVFAVIALWFFGRTLLAHL
jgi:hypothetical protein